MKTRELIASLIGGIAVYVACAAAPERSNEIGKPDVGAFSESGTDGPFADVLAVLDGVLPDMGVADAKADDAGAPQPTIVTGKCDKTYQASGQTFYYAELMFPGKSAQYLSAHATVTYCYTQAYAASSGIFPPGYNCQSYRGGIVRDGQMAVGCSVESQKNNIESISVSLE